MDCSVRETRQGHFAISTTDFFFPLIDHPYWQGYIGAANVLSDLYSQGVERCDFVLMLLAACRDMPQETRRICTAETVRGFRDACRYAEAPVTGGQTVLNPWPIVGGVATSVVSRGEFVPSDGAQPGDAVVLTKPLGTQVAVNLHQWRRKAQEAAQTGQKCFEANLWDKCIQTNLVSVADAETMLHRAVCSMARLNRTAGKLMLRHQANAATDVTGFGLLGHARNLVENQVNDLSMEIHTLPCLKKAAAVNDNAFDFRLTKGYSAETSGGLLVCLPPNKAEQYIRDLQRFDGCPAWIVGSLVASPQRNATLAPNVKILEVD